MAVENNDSGGMAEPDDVRRRALVRLGVAGLVTSIALAGLWWLDQGSKKKPVKPAAVLQPAPIVTAPRQESAPPQPAGEEPTAPEQAPAETPPAEPGKAIASAPAVARTESPPPPRVSNIPRTLGAPVMPPRAALPPATQPAPVGERFVVQLGVFSNPERARELVEQLRKQGIKAHTETRVELGPFNNRAEAERAQVEMRKLGFQALVSQPYATK